MRVAGEQNTWKICCSSICSSSSKKIRICLSFLWAQVMSFFLETAWTIDSFPIVLPLTYASENLGELCQWAAHHDLLDPPDQLPFWLLIYHFIVHIPHHKSVTNPTQWNIYILSPCEITPLSDRITTFIFITLSPSAKSRPQINEFYAVSPPPSQTKRETY